MIKKLIIIFTIIITVILIYSAIWLTVLISFSNSVNQKYANAYIDVQNQNNKQYFIKFTKVKPHGFPFKLAISIINWSEEGSSYKIEFKSPINIGYDLLRQQLFLSFSGEAIGRFKPVERGFGTKFHNQKLMLLAKIPLSTQLLKIILQKKNLFEIVNLVQDIKFSSDKIEIFDLIDNQKLYEEDHSLCVLSWKKSKYYTNQDDFLSNIPQKLIINYSTEVVESNIENRIIPAGLLLYRPAWTSNFQFAGNFVFKTHALNLKELTKDLEISINNARISGRNYESNINLLYKGSLNEQGNNDISLKTDIQATLKHGVIYDLLNVIKKYYTTQAYLVHNNIYNTINKLLFDIIEHKSEFDFTPIENRQYNLKFDTNLVTQSSALSRAQINNLSLYSEQTGFNLTNETIKNILKKSYSKGVVIFNNYSKIIDIFSPYLYNLSENRNFSEESKEVYKNALKLFMKTISDYPNSKSKDISFEYELDLSNLNKSTIGNIHDMNKIIPLYYLSLYHSAVKKIQTTDDLKTKILELVPSFHQHQKILRELAVPEFQEINNQLWQEIIK